MACTARVVTYGPHLNHIDEVLFLMKSANELRMVLRSSVHLHVLSVEEEHGRGQDRNVEIFHVYLYVFCVDVYHKNDGKLGHVALSLA